MIGNGAYGKRRGLRNGKFDIAGPCMYGHPAQGNTPGIQLYIAFVYAQLKAFGEIAQAHIVDPRGQPGRAKHVPHINTAAINPNLAGHALHVEFGARILYSDGLGQISQSDASGVAAVDSNLSGDLSELDIRSVTSKVHGSSDIVAPDQIATSCVDLHWPVNVLEPDPGILTTYIHGPGKPGDIEIAGRAGYFY